MYTQKIKAAIVISFVLISGCERGDIFEKPPLGSTELPRKPLETSYITVATIIPFSVLQKAIEANVPSQQSFSGSGKEPCADVPSVKRGNGLLDLPYIGFDEVCAGNKWSATARKSGSVSISRFNEAMRIAVPIDISGQAGLRGSIANVLSLTGKNFSASVKPIIDINLIIGNNWCPQISATPTTNWVSNASVQIVGKSCAQINLGPLGTPGFCAGPINLDLSTKANNALNEQQEAIKTAITNAVNCDQLRQSIQAQWKPIVVAVNDSGEKSLFLNITPESFAFSNIRVDDNALAFAVRAGVKAQLDEKAASTELMPLPPVGTITTDNSNLRVVIRANIGYDKIADELKKSLLGKTFMNTTPAGKLSVKIEDFEVYPSNGKIALGVKIAATLPAHNFDVHGWIYMTTAPSIDQSGTTVVLDELSYSAVLDNELWKSLVAIFDNQILQELHKNSHINLQPTISKSSKDLASRINSTSFPGIQINAEEPTAKLLDVAVDSKSLVATASVEMKFNVTVIEEVKPTASK